MKKPISLIFVWVTLFFVLVSNATFQAQASTPKPGTICTKVGATHTSAGKKYICTKAGSKLTWRLEVANQLKSETYPSPGVSVPPAKPKSDSLAKVPSVKEIVAISFGRMSLGFGPPDSSFEMLRSDEERIDGAVYCWVKKSNWFKNEFSFISILDENGAQVEKSSLSEIVPIQTKNGFIHRAEYELTYNEALNLANKRFTCEFTFTRQDHSMEVLLLPIAMQTLDSEPLVKPEVIATAKGGFRYENGEVGCFVKNWHRYSSWVPIKGTNRSSPTSMVYLLRDDGSIVDQSGLWPVSGRFFKWLKLDPTVSYAGLFFEDSSFDYAKEVTRSYGKVYSCKFVLQGFNGKSIEVTVPVKMPPFESK